MTTTILLEQELQANKSCITCTGTAFHLSTTNLINAPPLFGPSLDRCCLHVNCALPRNNILQLNGLMAAISRITILRFVLLIETVESSENLVRSWSHKRERDILRDLILILQLGTKVFDSLVNLQPPSIVWDNMGILDIAPTLKERVRTMQHIGKGPLMNQESHPHVKLQSWLNGSVADHSVGEVSYIAGGWVNRKGGLNLYYNSERAQKQT